MTDCVALVGFDSGQVARHSASPGVDAEQRSLSGEGEPGGGTDIGEFLEVGDECGLGGRGQHGISAVQ